MREKRDSLILSAGQHWSYQICASMPHGKPSGPTFNQSAMYRKTIDGGSTDRGAKHFREGTEITRREDNV